MNGAETGDADIHPVAVQTLKAQVMALTADTVVAIGAAFRGTVVRLTVAATLLTTRAPTWGSALL